MSQNNQKEFFGVVIPIKILNNNELTVSEKFIYSYITSYAKYCVDDNAKIAARLGMSEPTITRSLAKLQKMGYLAVEFVNNNSAKRKIYNIYGKGRKRPIFANKKISYNSSKRRSFPQSFAQLLYNKIEGNQNDEVGNQNDYPNNRGEGNQNDYHRIIRINRIKDDRTKTEQDDTPAGMAGVGPANRLDSIYITSY